MTRLQVVRPGPFTTMQDLGRPGLAAIGVGRSGACDRAALRRCNALLGNPDGVAALETTLGGLVLVPEDDVWLALTGAPCTGVPHDRTFLAAAGRPVRLGRVGQGLRSYLGVRGGLDVPAVLGSRSTDVLSGLGPAPVVAGQLLPVGRSEGAPPARHGRPPPAAAGDDPVRVLPGPRRDWFTDQAWHRLTGRPFRVDAASDRVGLRLSGGVLTRSRHDELPPEGLARGAVQVPPSGNPVVFLADHPITGGYPVIGYVHDEDVDRCAQLRPGRPLAFVEDRQPAPDPAG